MRAMRVRVFFLVLLIASTEAKSIRMGGKSSFHTHPRDEGSPSTAPRNLAFLLAQKLHQDVVAIKTTKIVHAHKHTPFDLEEELADTDKQADNKNKYKAVSSGSSSGASSGASLPVTSSFSMEWQSDQTNPDGSPSTADGQYTDTAWFDDKASIATSVGTVVGAGMGSAAAYLYAGGDSEKARNRRDMLARAHKMSTSYKCGSRVECVFETMETAKREDRHHAYVFLKRLIRAKSKAASEHDTLELIESVMGDFRPDKYSQMPEIIKELGQEINLILSDRQLHAHMYSNRAMRYAYAGPDYYLDTDLFSRIDVDPLAYFSAEAYTPVVLTELSDCMGLVFGLIKPPLPQLPPVELGDAVPLMFDEDGQVVEGSKPRTRPPPSHVTMAAISSKPPVLATSDDEHDDTSRPQPPPRTPAKRRVQKLPDFPEGVPETVKLTALQAYLTGYDDDTNGQLTVTQLVIATGMSTAVARVFARGDQVSLSELSALLSAAGEDLGIEQLGNVLKLTRRQSINLITKCLVETMQVSMLAESVFAAGVAASDSDVGDFEGASALTKAQLDAGFKSLGLYVRNGQEDVIMTQFDTESQDMITQQMIVGVLGGPDVIISAEQLSKVFQLPTKAPCVDMFKTIIVQVKGLKRENLGTGSVRASSLRIPLDMVVLYLTSSDDALVTKASIKAVMPTATDEAVDALLSTGADGQLTASEFHGVLVGKNEEAGSASEITVHTLATAFGVSIVDAVAFNANCLFSVVSVDLLMIYLFTYDTGEDDEEASLDAEEMAEAIGLTEKEATDLINGILNPEGDGAIAEFITHEQLLTALTAVAADGQFLNGPLIDDVFSREDATLLALIEYVRVSVLGLSIEGLTQYLVNTVSSDDRLDKNKFAALLSSTSEDAEQDIRPIQELAVANLFTLKFSHKNDNSAKRVLEFLTSKGDSKPTDDVTRELLMEKFPKTVPTRSSASMLLCNAAAAYVPVESMIKHLEQAYMDTHDVEDGNFLFTLDILAELLSVDKASLTTHMSAALGGAPASVLQGSINYDMVFSLFDQNKDGMVGVSTLVGILEVTRDAALELLSNVMDLVPSVEA